MQNVQLEDVILIDRANRGNRDALDQLIRKHTQRAYLYAHRLTRNEDEACEIVAEAFVRVTKALSKFKGDAAFTSWLYRIETNCFLDMKKRARNRMGISLNSGVDAQGEPTQFEMVSDELSPHEEVELNEQASVLQNAVGQLPPYYRVAIVMFHLEGLAYEEISEALDLPIGTVKSRLNRARIMLREILNPNPLFSQPAFGGSPAYA